MTRDRGFSDMIALIYRCTTSKILPVNLHSPSRLIPVRCKSFTYARSINLMLTSTGVTAWRALLVRSWMLTTRRVDSATVVARDMAPATSRRPPCPALPGPAWLSIPTGQTDVARETHYRRRFVRSKLRSVIHRRRGAYR